jgi:hypothetical protein
MKDERDGENDADRGTTKSGAVGLLREERPKGESWREQWEQRFRSVKAWPDTKMTRKEARGGRTQNNFEKLQDGILLLHDELESVTGRLEERGTEEELAQVEDLKKRAYSRHVMVDQAKRRCSTRTKGKQKSLAQAIEGQW